MPFFIASYGDKWRKGERISSGFTESAVNQVLSRANGQEAANTLDQKRCTPIAANSHPSSQW
jgi:hypothetical protein